MAKDYPTKFTFYEREKLLEYIGKRFRNRDLKECCKLPFLDKDGNGETRIEGIDESRTNEKNLMNTEIQLKKLIRETYGIFTEGAVMLAKDLDISQQAAQVIIRRCNPPRYENSMHY